MAASAPKNGSESPEPTLEEHVDQLNNENNVLHRLLLDQQRELKDCQDYIFSMQPRTHRLADSDALMEFNALYENVEEWVHTQVGDQIKTLVVNDLSRTSQVVRMVLSSIPPSGREAFRYKNTDKFNIIAMIMRFLCDRILDRDFYCVIEKGGLEFLGTIEAAMRNQTPEPDLIFCRTWHAETYLAITNRESFQTYSTKNRDTLVYDLTNFLGIFTPHLDQEVVGASIATSIVDPAIALAHKLHLSIDKYSFSWTPHQQQSWEERKTTIHDLSQFECVDLIVAGRTVTFGTQGRLYTYILDLCPGLVVAKCQSQSFKEPTILRQPRVLVAVTKKETGLYEPPLIEKGKPNTFLGMLEEKLEDRKRFIF